MAVLMTRTEQQSTVRSELSVASSGFALVTGSKINRKPIPPFTQAEPIPASPLEPTPDYDEDSINGDFSTEVFYRSEVNKINTCRQPYTTPRLNGSVNNSNRPLLESFSSAGGSSAVSKQTKLKINPSTQEITVEMCQLSPNSSTNESDIHLLQQKKEDCLHDKCTHTKKRCSKCTKREQILCGTVLILLLAVVLMAILLGLSGTCVVEILPACR